MQQTSSKQSSRIGKKKDKAGKPSKLFNIFLLFLIVILTASIVIGSIILFNIGGAKSAALKILSNVPIIGKVIKPIAENKTPEQIEMERLEAIENDIKIQLKQIEENIKELEEREMIISQKEDFLKEQEEIVNKRLEELNKNLNSIKEQAEYFEKMDSSKAMQIISNMESKGTVVQILRNMSKEKSSSILALMDPLQAAQVLEDIREIEREVYIYE